MPQAGIIWGVSFFLAILIVFSFIILFIKTILYIAVVFELSFFHIPASSSDIDKDDVITIFFKKYLPNYYKLFENIFTRKRVIKKIIKKLLFQSIIVRKNKILKLNLQTADNLRIHNEIIENIYAANAPPPVFLSLSFLKKGVI